MKQIYEKLVRDKILDIIRTSGKTPVCEVLNEREYALALDAKLDEEIAEYRHSGDIEELVDVMEVVLAIARARGISQDELEAMRKVKADSRGAFADRVFLMYVDEP